MAEFLKKVMGFFGRLVEKILGQAKKAKVTYEKKSGLSPLLSLESRLPLPKLRQLIDLFGERFFLPAFPSLKEKTVLEIGESGLKFERPVLEKKPKMFCGLMIGEENGAPNPPPGVSLYLKGSLKQIPFEDQFFDCVACRLTTPQQGDVISAFKEMGRILVPDGVGLVIDYHPFGLFAKGGAQRLRSVQANIRGVEDYFKMCRVAGLQVVDLHEGFVDDTLRNQFVTPQEMATFREIKGTPLVIFLKVVRLRK